MKPPAASIRVRLTLWYAAALSVLLLGFALGVYFFVQRSLTRQLERLLDEQFKAVETGLQEQEEADDLEELGQRRSVAFFEVKTGDQLVYCTPGWSRAGFDHALALARQRPVWSAAAADGQPYRLRSQNVPGNGQSYRLTVAVSAQTLHRTLRTLAAILLIGLTLAVGVALLGAYFLAGRVLAPIQAITAKAREITAERLSERLPVRNADDELGRLATVVNDLLARLDDSFQRLRRFTADASHELRTPLTAIRSVGEVALQEPREPAAYRDALGSILEETGHLSQLLDDLLTLTRADADRVALAGERISLATLAREVVDIVRVLAEDKGQVLRMTLDEAVQVDADPRALRQAALNLLDNAIKYTPTGGEIRIAVRENADGAAVLEVADNGPGISAEHHARIFERFYRVDPSRSVQHGVGLGLSIAQWAVTANGGTIELDSAPGQGTTFRMVLPPDIAPAARSQSTRRNTRGRQGRGV
jgi:heavy metal sensor kinase